MSNNIETTTCERLNESIQCALAHKIADRGDLKLTVRYTNPRITVVDITHRRLQQPLNPDHLTVITSISEAIAQEFPSLGTIIATPIGKPPKRVQMHIPLR